MLSREFQTHVDSFDLNDSDFRQHTRQKQVLLNVVFGQLCEQMQRDRKQIDVVGSVYWFLSGMLEASLKHNDAQALALTEVQNDLRVAVDDNQLTVAKLKQQHQSEAALLQTEVQDVIDAAETFEKEANMYQQKLFQSEQNFAVERQELQTQIESLQEENYHLLETLVRNTKDRADAALQI